MAGSCLFCMPVKKKESSALEGYLVTSCMIDFSTSSKAGAESDSVDSLEVCFLTDFDFLSLCDCSPEEALSEAFG